MNRKSVMGVMVMAAVLMSTQAVYAAPTAVHSPVNAIYSKVKLVKFSLRNDTSAPLKLKIGSNEVTLLPGKPLDVKVPDGQQIVAVDTTSNYAGGDVIATAAEQLDGTTVAIH